MPAHSSYGWRRSRWQAPLGWPAIRKRILARDGGRCRCTGCKACRPLRGPRCGAPASHVDHIVRGQDHRDVNLRALCDPCHRHKSATEGSLAAQGLRLRRQRPPEAHPGLLPARPRGDQPMASTDYPATPSTPEELPSSEDDRDDDIVPLDEPEGDEPEPLADPE